jgi:glycosyltransferase involved in cell wall biosynthesis
MRDKFCSTLNSFARILHLKRRFLVLPGSSLLKKESFPEICFAVTVCDEHKELRNLLDGILPYKKEKDEILVQSDSENITDEVRTVLKEYEDKIDKLVEFSLNQDFGAFKNNLLKHTQKEYIFQLDADEIPSPFLMENLHTILAYNPEVELIRVPRINIMIDDNKDFIKWDQVSSIEKKDLINFPDYQRRIFKNREGIQWIKRIHEKITGNKTIAYLPSKTEYCLLHCKRWKKQLKWLNYNFK